MRFKYKVCADGDTRWKQFGGSFPICWIRSGDFAGHAHERVKSAATLNENTVRMAHPFLARSQGSGEQLQSTVPTSLDWQEFWKRSKLRPAADSRQSLPNVLTPQEMARHLFSPCATVHTEYLFLYHFVLHRYTYLKLYIASI